MMHKFLLVAFCAVLSACKGGETKPITEATVAVPTAPAAPVKDNFTVSTLLPMVPLRLDDAQSFALYLPKNYTDSAKLPAIIFFDPHGDGSLPVNMYHEL